MHEQGHRIMASTEKELDLTHWLKPDTPSEVVRHVANMQDVMSLRELLPPPSELAEYEKMQPGAADRIIGLAEKGLSLESDTLEKETAITRHRLMASTIVSLSMIATAVMTIVFGPAWLSIPLGFGGVLTLALRDLLNRDRDRRNKSI